MMLSDITLTVSQNNMAPSSYSQLWKAGHLNPQCAIFHNPPILKTRKSRFKDGTVRLHNSNVHLPTPKPSTLALHHPSPHGAQRR